MTMWRRLAVFSLAAATAGLTLPTVAEAGHRHSRNCGHRYGYSSRGRGYGGHDGYRYDNRQSAYGYGYGRRPAYGHAGYGYGGHGYGHRCNRSCRHGYRGGYGYPDTYGGYGSYGDYGGGYGDPYYGYAPPPPPRYGRPTIGIYFGF